MMWLVYLVFTLVVTLVLYFIDNSKSEEAYFKKLGVQYLGYGYVNLFNNIRYKRSLKDALCVQYKTVKDSRCKSLVGGVQEFGKINFLVSDPNQLKSILVKDFDHFVNRRNLFNTSETFLARMLLFLTDEDWKALRGKLSPTFTTGKIKRLFNLIQKSTKSFISLIEQRIQGENELELTEVYNKLTMDIIASAVCGIDSQAFNQDEPSLFERMGQNMQLKFGGKFLIKLFFLMGLPRFAKLFGITLFPKKTVQFFSHAIKESILAHNEERREDFIQLMMEARAGLLKPDEGATMDTFEKEAQLKSSGTESERKDLLDDDGIIANCLLFILAGFDSTKSVLLYCAYALALHPEIQDRVREEIDGVMEESEGKELTYESVQKLKYLDMVISETLRFYPPTVITDRQCTQAYKIPGTEVKVKKGQGIIIPIYEIHHEEKYYPEPERFYPERFSPENKPSINPYTNLSFGHGPRNCIGMRFALTQVKVVIATLVHNFVIEPSSKTLIPMVYENSSSLMPKGGMWLALKKRT